MNPKRVFKKTAKGQEEMTSRKYGLSQNLRHVLIFVDGVADVAKILEKGSGCPNIEQHLEELASQGFIQSDDLTSISVIKEELIAAAKETLGPDAEKIVAKLKDALLNLDKDAEGTKVLAQFGALKFIETTAADYQPVFNMARAAGIDILKYRYRNQ